MEYKNSKKEFELFLNWQRELLAHKEKTVKIAQESLENLRSLFDEDRILFIRLLEKFFCFDCGLMFRDDLITTNHEYACDCDILKNKKN